MHKMKFANGNENEEKREKKYFFHSQKYIKQMYAAKICEDSILPLTNIHSGTRQQHQYELCETVDLFTKGLRKEQ